MDLLAAMRAYVRVVELGGLSAAARDLGLSQPTVSERLDRLEDHLRTRLLHRTTRSVRMTDVGALFYAKAKQALDAAMEAESAAAPHDGGLRGTLRVAAPYGLGELLIAPWLIHMRHRHPDLTVDLVFNDRVVDPVAEGVDISIRSGRVEDGQFVARRLGVIRRLLVASPGYVAGRGAPNSPDALLAHPLLRVPQLTSSDMLTLEGPQGAVSVPIRTGFLANHWRPLLRAALDGLGIAVLQTPMCAAELASGALVRVLPDHAPPALDVHAIYPAGRFVPAKTRLFVALLQDNLGAALR